MEEAMFFWGDTVYSDSFAQLWGAALTTELTNCGDEKV